MAKLSATIITYNEERNIGRCLDSLIDIADEVIVVDSYSKDKTVEICHQKGAKVIQQEWKGYAETKNFANKQVSNEFIISIDADEALSSELRKSIQSVKENLSGVYSFNRLTNYCGKWIYFCGWYPDKKIRIFPKSKVKWKGSYIHEEIILLEDLQKHFLKGDLYHYSYNSIDEHYQKNEKYALLNAQEMKVKNKRYWRYMPLWSAVSKFFTVYFLKLGILDGYYGFTIARISGYGNYLKYRKLKEIS